MRKKLIAIFMIAAMMTVFGPLELFAETGDGNDGSADTGNDIVLDTQEVTEGEDGTTEEPAQTEVNEDEEKTEEVVDSEEAEETAEPTRAAAGTISKLSVTVEDFTDTTATLAWTVAEDEAFGEGETLSVYNGSTLVKDNIDPSAGSVEITGLESATDYSFVFKIGDKTVSDPVSVTTKTSEVADFRALSSYKSVVLRWSEVPGATNYTVTVSGNGLNNKQLYSGAEVKDVVHDGLSVNYVINTKSGPVEEKNYEYTITATDASGKVIATSTKKGYPVKTMYYKLTFKQGATLTSHSGGSVKHTFKKGQVVYARGFDGGRFIFDYKCPDGKVRTYWTMRIRVTSAIWKEGHTRTGTPYTEEEALLYVNKRGIDSKTKYMVWVNTYTQREYVFKGKKGNWKLVKGPWLVSTGKAAKPTATGSTNISIKKKSNHGIPTWNMCRWFSLHGKKKSWTLGWPRSGACVRNYNANAKWIYDTCPLKTRVYVF